MDKRQILYKYLWLCVFILLMLLPAGCGKNLEPGPEPADEDKEKMTDEYVIGPEEKKRADLYIAVMREAYQVENGGDGFIAVKLETLEGLSDEGKQLVLEGLGDLSPCVCSFEEVKDEPGKFKRDDKGNLVRTLDGSLLYINLKEYKEDKAVITAVSWFGNLGAVFPKYEAVFVNGHWQLKLINMAVS